MCHNLSSTDLEAILLLKGMRDGKKPDFPGVVGEAKWKPLSTGVTAHLGALLVGWNCAASTLWFVIASFENSVRTQVLVSSAWGTMISLMLRWKSCRSPWTCQGVPWRSCCKSPCFIELSSLEVWVAGQGWQWEYGLESLEGPSLVFACPVDTFPITFFLSFSSRLILALTMIGGLLLVRLLPASPKSSGFQLGEILSLTGHLTMSGHTASSHSWEGRMLLASSE